MFLAVFSTMLLHQVFGNIGLVPSEDIDRHNNFRTFLSALLLLFRQDKSITNISISPTLLDLFSVLTHFIYPLTSSSFLGAPQERPGPTSCCLAREAGTVTSGHTGKMYWVSQVNGISVYFGPEGTRSGLKTKRFFLSIKAQELQIFSELCRKKHSLIEQHFSRAHCGTGDNLI